MIVTADSSLREFLSGTSYESYLDIDPSGRQLPSIIGVERGLRPAMDLWIQSDRLPAFAKWIRERGLVFVSDGFFEPLPLARSPTPREAYTTTRAKWRHDPAAGREAHVFLARQEGALEALVGPGWYPLVVGDTLVQKHPADHDAFGAALGYPACCRAFFRARNNWDVDNTPFAARAATRGEPVALSNFLPRHTAFGLVPHMACSFNCDATARQASRLLQEVTKDAPAYAKEIERRLRSPTLCLSELRVFRFEQATSTSQGVRYVGVEPIAPTRPDDPLADALREGDEITIESNILTVTHAGRLVTTYFARADTYGPEVPFVVECLS